MRPSLSGGRRTLWLTVAVLQICMAAGATGAPKSPQTCEEIAWTGEVNARHEWTAPFGEGWVFRVRPNPERKAAPGAGGWDLVVDRKRQTGHPDALMLASPPYHMINEREVATKFGLRAQDVIGWNPRKFRFMTDRSDFREAQRLFTALDRRGAFNAEPRIQDSGRKEKAFQQAMRRFVKLTQKSSPGEFRILDAHLTPGNGKVKPYAMNWARQWMNTPHTDEPAVGGQATPLGSLEWMRFKVTLWLPSGWKTPGKIPAERVPCSK
jgi:hypothetical protein